MPVLPYCILLRNSAISIPETGVMNSQVHQLRTGDLLALYSEIEKSNIPAKAFQPAALEFHQVVHAVFENAAVVPFRFPTWLTMQELTRHLQQESQRYTSFLTNHANHVQMEVRVTSRPISSPIGTSGTGHLRARAAESQRVRNIEDALKNLLSAQVIEWRERHTPAGLRLYALVARTNIAGFRERLSENEHQGNLRSSGPWPATEFLERNKSLHPES